MDAKLEMGRLNGIFSLKGYGGWRQTFHNGIQCSKDTKLTQGIYCVFIYKTKLCEEDG